MTPDGIAVITISGTLVKKASWMDAESGLQSYETIRTMLADARDDPGIRGVLLDVDSPGGEVGGLFDLADEVYAVARAEAVLRHRQRRGVLRCLRLASSAQRLFVTRTGGVGSIGVIAVHMDQSGWDEKMGRKYTAVYAGARKNDFSTHQPLSDDARANLQGEVDRLYEMFVASVARNRGICARARPEDGCWPVLGRKAISAGLADQVGSFDDALAAVTQASRASRQVRATASAEAQIEEGKEENDYGSNAIETKPADAPAPAAAPARTETLRRHRLRPLRSPHRPLRSGTRAAPPAAPVVDAAAIEARIRGEHEEIAALCTLAGDARILLRSHRASHDAWRRCASSAGAQGSAVAGHADQLARGRLAGRRGGAVERRGHADRGQQAHHVRDRRTWRR